MTINYSTAELILCHSGDSSFAMGMREKENKLEKNREHHLVRCSFSLSTDLWIAHKHIHGRGS